MTSYRLGRVVEGIEGGGSAELSETRGMELVRSPFVLARPDIRLARQDPRLSYYYLLRYIMLRE